MRDQVTILGHLAVWEPRLAAMRAQYDEDSRVEAELVAWLADKENRTQSSTARRDRELLLEAARERKGQMLHGATAMSADSLRELMAARGFKLDDLKTLPWMQRLVDDLRAEGAARRDMAAARGD